MAGEPAPVTLCHGCSDRGLCRFGVISEKLLRDGSVEIACSSSDAYEGGQGVAHGGWIAGVLDEALGRVPLLHGEPAVTAALDVRFVLPVPLGVTLLGRARPVSRRARRWHVEGQLMRAGTGTVLARANAVMVKPTERF